MKPSFKKSGFNFLPVIIHEDGRREVMHEGGPLASRADALKYARWHIADLQRGAAARKATGKPAKVWQTGRKATPNNTRPGDVVQSVRRLSCRYYDYPAGQNLLTFPAGQLFTVESIPAKVRKYPADFEAGIDGQDYFLNLIPVDWPEKTTGAACNFCAVRLIK